MFNPREKIQVIDYLGTTYNEIRLNSTNTPHKHEENPNENTKEEEKHNQKTKTTIS